MAMLQDVGFRVRKQANFKFLVKFKIEATNLCSGMSLDDISTSYENWLLQKYVAQNTKNLFGNRTFKTVWNLYRGTEFWRK